MKRKVSLFTTGTPVSEERVKQAFDADIQTVLKDVYSWSDDCNSWPSEVKEIIANMMFNMGLTRMNGFVNFKYEQSINTKYVI